jgi:hypothetical protein|nr:hypothetical protein [uncultured Actinomyces sp.]
MTTLPDSLSSALPTRERRSPGLKLEDGRWMAAAKSGLYVFGAEASSNESEKSKGDATPQIFPWYDVARARWEAEGELFALEWVDPARAALAGRSQGDPDEFMRQVSEYVNRSIVLHSQVEVGNGTTITAWVRRGPDGLFSILTADGPLDAAAQRQADALEASVRDAVGLD